jgi:hypothetical protein
MDDFAALLLGFGIGIFLLAVILFGLGATPRQVARELAQSHCEQRGFAIGRYEDDRIVCYQRVEAVQFVD